MKRLLLILLLIPALCFAQEPSPVPLNIQELDGSLSAYPYQILVPNNGIEAVTGGIVELNYAPASSLGWTDDGTVVRLTTSTDSVGVGTNSPQRLFHLYRETTSNTGLFTMEVVNNDNTSGPTNNFWRARGTTASKTVPSSGDIIGGLNFDAYDGTDYNSVASIKATLDGAGGVGDVPGKLSFLTTPDGTATAVTRMTIGNDGSIIINDAGVSTADVRMEGDTDANLFFLDASSDAVLIGTSTPTSGTKFNVYQDAGSGTTELGSFNLVNSSTLSGTTNMVPLESTVEWTGDKNNRTINVYGFYGSATASSNLNSLTGCQYLASLSSGTATQARSLNPILTVSGTVTTADTIFGSAINTGTITTFYGDRMQLLNNGTITTAYGYYADFAGANDPTTTYGFYGNIAKGTTKWGLYLTGDVYNSLGGGLIVNEDGNDSDTRFEGDTNANLVYLDAGNDRVGIGKNNPATILDVNGTGTFSQIIDSGLTASKVVFTDNSQQLTSTGIGASSQFIKGDGSLDSSTYLTAESDTLNTVCGRGASYTAGNVTLLGVTIGANTLDTSEWAYLDGQNQTVATTSSPTFANLVITSGGDIKPSANSTTAINIAQADGTNFVTFDSTNKRIGLNVTPTVPLDMTSTVNQLVRFVSTAASSSTSGSGVNCYSNDGAAMASGDRLGWLILGGASDASGTLVNPVAINGYAAENFSSTNQGGHLVFATTPIGSTTASRAERLRVLDSGRIGIMTTAPDRETEINDSSGNCLRLTYNDSNGSATYYTDFLVSSAGLLSLNAVGGVRINDTGADADTVIEGDTNTSLFYVDAGNDRVGIGTTAPDKSLEVNSATGGCLRLTYNDSNGSATTKTDLDVDSTGQLTITSPTGKTPYISPVVYDDLQFNIAAGKVPGANFPTWETFTTNTSAYAFSVNDYIDCGANELPHWWSQGTAGDAHLHFTIKTAQSTGANRYAKFTVVFAYADTNEAWVESTLTAEYTIPTGTAALTNLYLDLGNLTFTDYLVGAQIRCRITRIAATGGTEYADDVYITQCGVHLQKDSLGSRTETVK
jgi:hypothetical protein